MKKMLLIGFIALSFNVNAQNANNNFNPEGNVYGKIYSNFHSSLNDDIDDSGFEIKRVYFGYKYKMTSNFSANIKLDIGSDNALKRYTYVKNAELIYTKDKLKINFGMINLYECCLQTKTWGHRYINKALLTKYNLGQTADIGVSMLYKFNKFVSADITITNGEGYANIQQDNAFQSAIGVTVKPNDKITARVYGDYSEKAEKELTFTSLLAYEATKDLSFGVEYNYKHNNKFIAEHNVYGFSSYISYDINDKFELFGRFDDLSSNTLEGDNDPWNYNKEGQFIVGGVQFKPISKVKIAANIQDWAPADNSDRETLFFINLEYKL
ncbi:MAG: hypothetical protein U9R54_08665 [Bacteroidota bacterium]|nr:hypothetical protein [Bacteroidota bacterium]